MGLLIISRRDSGGPVERKANLHSPAQGLTGHGSPWSREPDRPCSRWRWRVTTRVMIGNVVTSAVFLGSRPACQRSRAAATGTRFR